MVLLLQDIGYAVMIDAGSSGSRVHVYNYNPPAAAGMYASVRLPEARMKVSPGLSSFAAAHGRGAGDSLVPLLEFAKQQVRFNGQDHCPQDH
jgi:apyrase